MNHETFRVMHTVRDFMKTAIVTDLSMDGLRIFMTIKYGNGLKACLASLPTYVFRYHPLEEHYPSSCFLQCATVL